MTYILGAKCKDGIVIVADRKAKRGEKSFYTDKIRPVPNFEYIVFAAAGIEPIFNEFLNELPRRVINRIHLFEYQNQELPKDFPEEAKYEYTTFNFKQDCISLINEMYSVYENTELPDDTSTLQVIFVLEDIIEHKPQPVLYYMDWGYRVPIPIYDKVVIGQAHLGDVFLRCWDTNYTMDETIKLASFIIYYIERERLSDSIGVGKLKPQVWKFPNNDKPFQLTDDVIEIIIEGVDEKVEEVRKSIGSMSSMFRYP